MARRRSKPIEKPKQVPKVRLCRPRKRPYQLRYDCPIEKREVRISTGTYDLTEAEQQRRELEAKLLLGLPTHEKKLEALGPDMDWSEFREHYRTLHWPLYGTAQLLMPKAGWTWQREF
jgi:hypothetical protein